MKDFLEAIGFIMVCGFFIAGVVLFIYAMSVLEDCKDRFGGSPSYCISHFLTYEEKGQ